MDFKEKLIFFPHMRPTNKENNLDFYSAYIQLTGNKSIFFLNTES